MSSVEKWRPAKGSKSPRWRARWRTPDGRAQSKVFDRKVDAEDHLATVRATVLTGTYVDPNAGRVTFQAYAEEWRRRQVHRESTQAQVEGYLRLHAYPTLGDRPMASIRRSEVQAWVQALDAGHLSAGSVRMVYGFVAGVFRDAVFDRVVPATPCVRIALPKTTKVEVVPPTLDQVEAIVAAMPARYRAAAIVAAGAGLRSGEVRGLTLDRVDFLRRTIRVDRQLVTPSKGPARFGPPKTPSSVRTVPAADVVLEALARHLEAHPVETDGEFAGALFTTEYGNPARNGTWSPMWNRATTAAAATLAEAAAQVRAPEARVDAARLAAATASVRFHDLRHYFASALIAQGCSVKAVQAALGHKTATETLETYAHLWPSDADSTRAAVQRAFGAPVAQACHGDQLADG